MSLYIVENQMHNRKYVVASNLEEAINKYKEKFKNTDDDYDIISAALVSQTVIIGE